MATRVLVVEDSATQAEALRALLEGAGYAVTVATGGAAGLAQVAAHPFDVVISDIVMPGAIDGYELCKRIKAGPRRAVPVVLLTSLSDPLDLVHGLASGADKFFTKPFDPDDLLDRLRVLLTTRAARARAGDGAGLTVLFMGREFTVTAEREQILDLLVSTFEDAVRQNRELRRREEELEATNRELETFTYSVSHDLRAPLRHVGGFARLLLEDLGPDVSPAVQGHVDRISEGARRMARMVDDLLELSRLNRRDLQREVTRLNGVVEEVVAQLAPDTAERAITWKIGALPTVACDRGLMAVVFTNLLSNAVKYTRTRTPAVIEVAAHETQGQVGVLVRDNGVGFDMAYAGKLFGAFQRLHRADEFEGTGVGLATVQRIVHRHGGRIWAEATPGAGATFYVTLGVPAS